MEQGICSFPRISTKSLVHRQNVQIHMPYAVRHFIKQPFELTFPGHRSNLEHGLDICTRVLWGQVPCPAMHGVALHHAHVVESTLISLLRADQILQALWSLTRCSSARATGLHGPAVPCRSSHCRPWRMTLCVIPLHETTSAPGADGEYANTGAT